ncbi:MAG: twin-arginine translocase TatA/TatE family subunit [Acidobacteria bacterium]|nr:twin-arginine translocase TatA/TatE family subunit [Acidobacteriota bacterium]
MGPLGFTEILFILLLALLLFGPRRLPELGRTLGRGLAEFRRASNDLRTTIEDEVRALEREATPEPDSSPTEPRKPPVGS